MARLEVFNEGSKDDTHRRGPDGGCCSREGPDRSFLQNSRNLLLKVQSITAVQARVCPSCCESTANTNGCDCVPMQLYLQKQMAGPLARGRAVVCSLHEQTSVPMSHFHQGIPHPLQDGAEKGLKKVPRALFKLRVKNHLPVKGSNCPGFPSRPCQSDVKNLFLISFFKLGKFQKYTIERDDHEPSPSPPPFPFSFLLVLGWQFTGGPGHTKASAVPIEVNLASVSQTFQSAAEVIKPEVPNYSS